MYWASASWSGLPKGLSAWATTTTKRKPNLGHERGREAGREAVTDKGAGASLRPIVGVMAVISVFYGLFVWLRIDQFGVLWFVHLGHHFLGSTHSSVVGTNLPAQSTLGYDGQYYFAIAADPVHAHDYLPGGNAGYLYSRPLYPLLARALSGGSISALPYGMLLVNLVSVMVGALAVALWLRKRNVSPWYALLYGLWPGLIFSVFRDLTEPLAFGLVAVAVLVFDPKRTRRIVIASVLLALALLTRETVLPFVVATAVALALSDRRRTSSTARSWTTLGGTRRAFVMLAACVLPLFVWRSVISSWLAKSTQEHGSGLSWAIPLHGLLTYWRFDEQHWLVVGAVVMPLLIVTIAALFKGLLRSDPVATGLLLASVLLFIIFLPKEVYVDYASAARAALGVVLAAVFCVPAFVRAGARRLSLATGSFLLSLGWYLVVATALGLPGLSLVTM